MSQHTTPAPKNLKLNGRHFLARVGTCAKSHCDRPHTMIGEQDARGEKLKGGLFFKLSFPLTHERLPEAESLEGRLVKLLNDDWWDKSACTNADL